MRKQLLVCLNVLLLRLQTTSAACADNSTFTVKKKRPGRNCNWVKRDESRRQGFCQIPKVSKGCPFTCGTCCEDDKTFIHKGDTHFDCKWLALDEKRANTWCPETLKDEADGSNVKVEKKCPKTCGLCSDEVSSKPLKGCLSSYPEYDGDLEVLGRVKVWYKNHKKFTLKYKFKGLGADCVGCEISIHKGTSCETSDGPSRKYWNRKVLSEDPWNSQLIQYNSSDGSALGSLILSNGYSNDENNGHTVVVRDAGNVRIACGVISDARSANCFSPLSGCMTSYPAYDGDLEVSGRVKVEYTKHKYKPNRFKFTYDLKGFEADCVDCGIHIHEGTSCATVDEVLDHYWDPVLIPEDPWNEDTVYTSSSDGSASGSFFFE